jgi:hypothetical protein
MRKTNSLFRGFLHPYTILCLYPDLRSQLHIQIFSTATAKPLGTPFFQGILRQDLSPVEVRDPAAISEDYSIKCAARNKYPLALFVITKSQVPGRIFLETKPKIWYKSNGVYNSQLNYHF